MLTFWQRENFPGAFLQDTSWDWPQPWEGAKASRWIRAKF